MFFFTLECQESSVLGGMLIVHKLHEGKNEYKVADVVKCRNANGEKTFARYSTDADKKLLSCIGLDRVMNVSMF